MSFLVRVRRPFTTRLVRVCTLTTTAPEVFLERLESHPGVACLSLNRPHVKNAISFGLMKDMTDCLHVAHFDKTVRVLILRSSTPGSFCAGADLTERRSLSDVQTAQWHLSLRDTLGKLESLPMPTIAAIDGPALGGGLEMSLACDLRVAGHAVSKIGFPETGLGIIPGGGGTQRVTRILGPAKAKDLIFTARKLSAVEAHQYGLVDYISEPHSSGFERALKLAEEIAVNAPLALRSAKRAISRAEDLALEPGLDLERAAYDVLLTTKDRREALEAFKEKRRPVFIGE